MDMNEYVGKRCLLIVAVKFCSGVVEEFKVLELSPSGNWVKLMNLNGRKLWKALSEISFVELLKDFNIEKPE
jgi:hypothetical protein